MNGGVTEGLWLDACIILPVCMYEWRIHIMDCDWMFAIVIYIICINGGVT